MFMLLTVAIAPGLALFSYFYLRKQIHKDPSRSLLQTYVYGMMLTFPILFIQYVFDEERVFGSAFINDVLFTSGLEEFFKWLVLLVVVYSHVDFEDPYDGILFGASVSLGFATVENILFLLTFGMDEALIRALLPVSSHALFGVVMGYYLGRAKFVEESGTKPMLFLSFFAAFGLHFVYNSLVMAGNFRMYLLIPFMLFLWWFALKRVKRAHTLSVDQYIQKQRTMR
ncbi:Membrane proteinase PrsW, cleaves anti-sigma factor RsiW, M82 family [Bhargavaea ginsengi]|uniref:Protease PrsW n=1 Tax=Bhargavaea ginsengi TaxID=426757 RepID=A0A1H6SPN9_9BACL|nr:glutamic-type intramembrane protease PrsW [Bhargavaea ginsengi]MCM3088204.1 glutamic-type intramembrane protease PrsW [Bhargavaea ginsengi]SEI65825.1 Membrane proteinase PrsW, cleaves anti-sigma factor RsiW, M82 family [Bhargavaea ginsengi]